MQQTQCSKWKWVCMCARWHRTSPRRTIHKLANASLLISHFPSFTASPSFLFSFLFSHPFDFLLLIFSLFNWVQLDNLIYWQMKKKKIIAENSINYRTLEKQTNHKRIPLKVSFFLKIASIHYDRSKNFKIIKFPAEKKRNSWRKFKSSIEGKMPKKIGFFFPFFEFLTYRNLRF